jgi:hypothetical protein
LLAFGINGAGIVTETKLQFAACKWGVPNKPKNQAANSEKLPEFALM